MSVRRKPQLQSELGYVSIGVLGIRLTELKHSIGLTKLNCLEFGHAPVGVLGREALGVLMGRPRLSHHVSHCVAPPATAIGLVSLLKRNVRGLYALKLSCLTLVALLASDMLYRLLTCTALFRHNDALSR